MTKLYTKPKVSDGEWYRCSDIYTTHTTKNEEHLFIAVQEIDGTEQDHYRIYINDKPVPRKTYFGEMAHNDVVRDAADLLHWSASLWYDGLFSISCEKVS